MTEVKIIIKTTDDMKDFIFFLHKSGLSIQTQEDTSFYDLLYKSLIEKKIYPAWLKKNNLLHYLNNLKQSYPDLLYVENDYLLSNIPRKPTAVFAQACGKESLNSEGLISTESAYNFIMRQAVYMKLSMIDDTIYLNEYLQNLLNINSGKIDRYELVLLLDNLFSDRPLRNSS